MRIKFFAGCGFLLNTIFFATYYSVAKEALGRIDPLVFSFFEMITLVPVALLIILCTWRYMTRAVVKRGILLGSVLCLALFTIAIALKYTTATSTAFFPALNGFVAALIAWTLFRQPMKRWTWVAGIISLMGALLLIFTSSFGNIRGTLIAFLGGLFYTAYIFLGDEERKNDRSSWALFGIELLTTAVWASLVVLLFGDWQSVHPSMPRDLWIVLYVSIACTFVPTLITVLGQKHISPVTVSFIYILEPVLGAIVAFFYLHETLPIQGYIGGGLVVLGAVVHTWGTMDRSPEKLSVSREGNSSWFGTLAYPALGSVLGFLLLYKLGGFPPTSWHEVSQIWSQIPHSIQQGQGTYIVLLMVQAGGWLVAWISVLLMGCMALYHTLQRLGEAANSSERKRLESVPHMVQPALAQTLPSAPVEPRRQLKPSVPVPQMARAARTQNTQFVSFESHEQVRPSLPKPQAGQPMPWPPVATRIPQHSQPVHATQSVHRTTTGQVLQPARRVRTTVRLPEQPTWYGEVMRPDTSPDALASGKGYMTPITEPLNMGPRNAEVAQPSNRRTSLVQH